MIRLSEAMAQMEGRLVSDGEFETLGFCHPAPPMSFVTFLENPKYITDVEKNPNVTCIICTEAAAKVLPAHVKGVFVTDLPKLRLFELHNSLADDERYCPPSFPTKIGKNCKISPLAYIAEENVIIGDNVVIEEFVSIRGRTTIKDNCAIHANTAIGNKGFVYAKDAQGVPHPVVDLGGVVLEEDVEILPLNNVSLGTFPWQITHIGKHVKVDTHCQIAHFVRLGQKTSMASCACIAGDVELGESCWCGVNTTIRNSIRIGKDSRISMGAVVTKDVPDGTTVTGNFAIEHGRFMKQLKASLEQE